MGDGCGATSAGAEGAGTCATSRVTGAWNRAGGKEHEMCTKDGGGTEEALGHCGTLDTCGMDMVADPSATRWAHDGHTMKLPWGWDLHWKLGGRHCRGYWCHQWHLPVCVAYEHVSTVGLGAGGVQVDMTLRLRLHQYCRCRTHMSRQTRQHWGIISHAALGCHLSCSTRVSSLIHH